MRLNKPRVAPLSDAELSAEQIDLLSPTRGGAGLRSGQIFNLARTVAQAPQALGGFLAWGGYVLSEHNTLPVRDRELMILRVGYLCNSGYEWTHHRALGLGAGLSDIEIAGIRRGGNAALWSTKDQALLNVCDDLVRDHFVSDVTWSALNAHFSGRQCMDAVFTAAQYVQVAMILNSFGVQLEEGLHNDL